MLLIHYDIHVYTCTCSLGYCYMILAIELTHNSGHIHIHVLNIIVCVYMCVHVRWFHVVLYVTSLPGSPSPEKHLGGPGGDPGPRLCVVSVLKPLTLLVKSGKTPLAYYFSS